jgi:hypothetical protein
MSKPTETARRRYRWIENEDAPGGRQRVLVVTHRGVEGHVVRWTDACSGCCERGDYGTLYYGGHDPKTGMVIGAGCPECGHTGKRREEQFVPFDHAAWSAALCQDGAA